MSEVTEGEVKEFGDFLDEQFGGEDESSDVPQESDSKEEPGATEADAPAEEPAATEEPVDKTEDVPKTESSDNTDADDSGDSTDEVDWEKRYKDQLAYINRKEATIEEQVQQQVQAAMQEQMMQQQQQAQAMQAQQPVDMNVLSQQVAQDPANTFQLAVAQRPDLVPHVISFIEEHHGAAEAEQARHAAFQMQQMQQQQMIQAQLQQYEEMRHAEQMPQLIEQGIDSIVADIAENPDYKEVFPELQEPAAEMLQAEWKSYTEQAGHPPPPDQWHGLVEKSFLRAWQAQTAANAKKQEAPPAPPQHVETGDATRVEAPSGIQAIPDQLVELYNEGRFQ